MALRQQQQLDQQKNIDSYVQAYNYLYYFDNSDNVILTKQDMKKLLDRDSDNRLIENGYYYTSHLTNDDYTKLWDMYKSWAEDENPNLYKFIIAQEQTDQQIAQVRYGIIKQKPQPQSIPQSIQPDRRSTLIQVYQPIRTIQPLKPKAKKQAQSINSVDELNKLKQQVMDIVTEQEQFNLDNDIDPNTKINAMLQQQSISTKQSFYTSFLNHKFNQKQFKVLDQIAETVNFVDQSLSQWYDQYILQYSEKYPQKIYTKYKPKKSKKLEKDDLFEVITQKQFPFKSKYDVIRKANYYDIPTHQTKNQFDIYPQTNTLEPHDYQLKPLSKFERPYFSPNYNSWEIDQVFIMKKSVEIKQYLFAININTKFLVVIPVKSKSQIPILDALKQLISLVPIDDIRGDGEKSYASKLLNDFYKKTTQIHSSQATNSLIIIEQLTEQFEQLEMRLAITFMNLLMNN
ncbi:MAG: hypothetical protein EZS28_025376 [Streblomastix strix]|uniref:Integrase catalytic domain-containing protein n=1 Tax=Streblomastix strix TaxID=222440 RepID=A0A5J4V9D3_9EUKA|nr:MAG: hypothetical protein EZS28_025376 [Streblomastix strix]